jgi:alanyl-tRNA synthetase
MELWNHVSLRYQRHADGSLQPLPQRSVDTGMGLERLLMVLQGQSSVFRCDIFEPWMSTLRSLWQPNERSLRILADHLRASIVIIADGVRPSNTGRGYVLRRLLRRALTILWRDDLKRSLRELPDPLISETLTRFDQPNGPVRDVIQREEQRFAALLNRGRKVVAQFEPGRPLSEEQLTYLHETHGLPPELVTELLHS